MMYAIRNVRTGHWVANDCHGNPWQSKQKLDMDCLLDKQQFDKAMQSHKDTQVIRFTQY